MSLHLRALVVLDLGDNLATTAEELRRQLEAHGYRPALVNVGLDHELPHEPTDGHISTRVAVSSAFAETVLGWMPVLHLAFNGDDPEAVREITFLGDARSLDFRRHALPQRHRTRHKRNNQTPQARRARPNPPTLPTLDMVSTLPRYARTRPGTVWHMARRWSLGSTIVAQCGRRIPIGPADLPRPDTIDKQPRNGENQTTTERPHPSTLCRMCSESPRARAIATHPAVASLIRIATPETSTPPSLFPEEAQPE